MLNWRQKGSDAPRLQTGENHLLFFLLLWLTDDIYPQKPGRRTGMECRKEHMFQSCLTGNLCVLGLRACQWTEKTHIPSRSPDMRVKTWKQSLWGTSLQSASRSNETHETKEENKNLFYDRVEATTYSLMSLSASAASVTSQRQTDAMFPVYNTTQHRCHGWCVNTGTQKHDPVLIESSALTVTLTYVRSWFISSASLHVVVQSKKQDHNS